MEPSGLLISFMLSAFMTHIPTIVDHCTSIVENGVTETSENVIIFAVNSGYNLHSLS